MATIPIMRANGLPGSPSHLIEVSMTFRYYEYLITDLCFVFFAPKLERACGLAMHAIEMERLVWQKLGSIMTIQL